MTVPCVCLMGDHLEFAECFHLQPEPAAFPALLIWKALELGASVPCRLHVANPSSLEMNWDVGTGSCQALKRCLMMGLFSPVVSVDLPRKETWKLHLTLRKLWIETIHQAQAAVDLSVSSWHPCCLYHRYQLNHCPAS